MHSSKRWEYTEVDTSRTDIGDEIRRWLDRGAEVHLYPRDGASKTSVLLRVPERTS